MNLVAEYEDGLWRTIEFLGISGSIRDKILVAVGIQFAVSIGQSLLPVFYSGPIRTELSAILFLLAAVAFANTVLIVRRDIIDPITGLEAAATDISNGDIETAVPTTRHDDEIGRLVDAFDSMVENLRLIADQSTALASQSFDDPVLDDQVPGRFGRVLSTMLADLTDYIDQIEADRDRFQLLNYLVGHDIPNILTVVYGRLELLEESTHDADVQDQLRTIKNQVREIEEISNSVSQLTSDKLLLTIDVVEIVETSISEVANTHSEATITFQSPDSPMYVRANNLLSRTVVNLINNAIVHNDASRPQVEVAVFADGPDDVAIRIQDNGPGIEFDDAEAFLSSLPPGTGLHIAVTIVQRFGGDFAISADDSGTSVTATLPRSNP